MIKLAKTISDFFRVIYQKLFLINDTPRRIALGLGLGVFSGILPGTGPLAALFLAFLFRANRAAALLGSVVTNTWLSLAALLLSVRIGSVLSGRDWHKVYQDGNSLIKDFHWESFFKASFLKIIWPVVLGYFVFSFILGLGTFLVSYLILKIARGRS